MTRWLVLRLHAPLAAFGGETIDARGVTRDFPALSALSGLLANALGYERHDTARHQALQDRLIFAARRDLDPVLGRLTDFQTVKLAKGDQGWTTRGGAEGRAGGEDTYASPHIRYRDHHADLRMTIVLTLLSDDAEPSLDTLAAALDRPARPIFIGRKPCLPSRPVFGGLIEADSAVEALRTVPLLEGDDDGPLRAIWPAEVEGPADWITDITDQRNWRTGLHGGARRIAYGRIRPATATGAGAEAARRDRP